MWTLGEENIELAARATLCFYLHVKIHVESSSHTMVFFSRKGHTELTLQKSGTRNPTYGTS